MIHYVSEAGMRNEVVWDNIRDIVQNQIDLKELDLENQVRMRNIMLKQYPDDLELQTQLEYFG